MTAQKRISSDNWIKDVKPKLASGIHWAYEDWIPGKEEWLAWPNGPQQNFMKGDLVILKQRGMATHLVEIEDEQARKTNNTEYPYQRKVRVIANKLSGNEYRALKQLVTFSTRGGYHGNGVRLASFS